MSVVLEGVAHRYGLCGVDLRFQPGEAVLITGRSGCGKSTLLRVIAGLVVPARGVVRCEGRVGMVFQEPGDQLLAGSVAGELELAARAAGLPVDPAALCGLVGLTCPLQARPDELSGGQQQRLAVAACLAQRADIVVLDEPLAHLDLAGRVGLLGVLKQLVQAGTLVIVVEHRLELLHGWADRVVVLDQGRVVHDGGFPTLEVLEARDLEVPARLQLSVPIEQLGPRAPREHTTGPSIHLLQGLELRQGERVALLGVNGSGKSTLLASWASTLGARTVWVPQDPDLSLLADSVRDEVGVEHGALLVPFGLGGLEDRAPQSLSRGERLRLAVAACLAVSPEVLLLDEPTAGQHGAAVVDVLAEVDRRLGPGVVVFATHDLGLALRFATTIAIVSDGRIVAAGPPGTLLPEDLGWLPTRQLELGFPVVDLDQQRMGPPGAPGSVQRVGSEVLQRARSATAPTGVLQGLAVLAVGVLSITVESPFTLWILAGLACGFLLTRPLARSTKAWIVGAQLALVWSVLLSQGLFYGDRPRTVAVSLGPWAVYHEGLRWGLLQSARLVASSSMGLAFVLPTSTDRLLPLLRALRLPASLGFLGVMGVRFLPTVASEWSRIRAARARRLGRAWSGPLQGLRREVRMLLPLLARALRRANRLGESLQSRGISVASPPVDALHWTTADKMGGAALLILVGGVLLMQGLTAAYVWELAYWPALRPLYAGVRTWL